MSRLYRILPVAEWAEALTEGTYRGSAHDLIDGFIHLSAPHQVEGTLAAHYATRADLVLLAIDADALASSESGKLVWEPSRDGQRFPHFYGALPLSLVRESSRIVLDANGKHVVPLL